MAKKSAVKQLSEIKLRNGSIHLIDDGKKFLSIHVSIIGGYASALLSDKRSMKSLQRMITKALK